MSEQITTSGFTNGVGKKERNETEVLAKARRRNLSTAIVWDSEECQFIHALESCGYKEIHGTRIILISQAVDS